MPFSSDDECPHKRRHKSRSKHFNDIFTELSAEALRTKHHHFPGHCLVETKCKLQERDRMVYMKELTRYRKLYIEMTELLRDTKKAFSKRQKAFEKKEAEYKEEMETKEANFTKAIAGLQQSFTSLETSLHQAQIQNAGLAEQISTLTRDRDAAKADTKKLTTELFACKDGLAQAGLAKEATTSQMKKQSEDMSSVIKRQQAEVERLRAQLVVSGSELQKETNANAWNAARIRELEEAVEEIWSAQSARASLDSDSINKAYADLRATSKELKQVQGELALKTAVVQQQESDNERQKTLIEMQQREIRSQKQTITTLNSLIQKLANKQEDANRTLNKASLDASSADNVSAISTLGGGVSALAGLGIGGGGQSFNAGASTASSVGVNPFNMTSTTAGSTS